MIEYLCISAQKSKISKDAPNSLLNLLADLKLYDGMISREVNFRPSDLSSVFNSSKGKTYLKQLFQQDGEVIESGNHQDLLSQSGLYADLCKTSFLEESEESL